jgi:hypothetical protein
MRASRSARASRRISPTDRRMRGCPMNGIIAATKVPLGSSKLNCCAKESGRAFYTHEPGKVRLLRERRIRLPYAALTLFAFSNIGKADAEPGACQSTRVPESPTAETAGPATPNDSSCPRQRPNVAAELRSLSYLRKTKPGQGGFSRISNPMYFHLRRSSGCLSTQISFAPLGEFPFTLRRRWDVFDC